MSQERPIRLHAGPWSLEFEPWSGWIRAVKLGDMEVVRAIYAAIRDENWATKRTQVSTSHQGQSDGSFEITWTAESDDPDYRFEGTVVGDHETLKVSIRGESSATYLSRRTGMCVLHPLELAGTLAKVVHSDGTETFRSFPKFIQPDQPFLDVRTLTHSVGDAEVQLEFSGEVFEMEDQRNWSDASFKTYCRPQEWPQPFEVKPGEVLEHTLSISYTGEIQQAETKRVELGDVTETLTLPLIGAYGNSTPDGLDFHLGKESWEDAPFDGLKNFGSNFVDFNRSDRSLEGYQGIAFGASPQIHAFDQRSIMENVKGIRAVCESARAIIGAEKKLLLGPVLMRPEGGGRDDRMDEAIAPAWFLATILESARGDANAICIGESHDYHGRIKEIAELFGNEASRSIDLYETSHPYEVMGVKFGGATDVVINLSPYALFVHFKHQELELDPYEVRVISPE